MNKISYLTELKEKVGYYVGTNKEEIAVKCAHELADEFKDSRYQAFLGGYYKVKDLEKGIKYLKLSAEQGYIKSAIVLGKIYADKKDSRSLLDLVNMVDKFEHNYIFLLKIYNAYICENEKDIDNIVKECIDYNSTQIHPVIQTAFNYYDKKQNYKKSFEMLKLLEKYYDHSAYYKISQYYKDGKGVESDFDKYFEYLLLANDAISNNELGMIYLYGQGVDIDYNKALFYFNCSYKKGNSLAPFGMASVFDSKQSILYSPKKRNQCLELFFKINKNNAKTIEIVRNFIYTMEEDVKVLARDLMKKYWDIEDFEA